MAAFVPNIQDNRMLRKAVPVTRAMGSYIVPETFTTRLGGGVDDTCNLCAYEHCKEKWGDTSDTSI